LKPEPRACRTLSPKGIAGQPAADQFEFAFAPQSPPRFRQSEFPWRYKIYRGRPNFEAFKRLRHLLAQSARSSEQRCEQAQEKN
jgi:hypothetical protein